MHAASLILDDCRRWTTRRCGAGGAANHLEFGEAIAILAAFGLLNLAFGSWRAATSRPGRAPGGTARRRGRADGLIGGQAADLLATDQADQLRDAGADPSRQDRRAVRRRRRARRADRRRPPRRPIAALSAYAKNLGLAFQIVDDLLDVEGDPAETGKAVRATTPARRRSSRSAAWTARGSWRAELCETADRALAPFGRRADRLRELSAFVAGRSV